MLPLFDPNRILLHSSSMRKYMVRVNKLDNHSPHTYTHIGPGPGVEARDAARPGRARRGGCGQLLRAAAAAGRRDAGTPGTSSGSGPEVGLELGRNPARKAALFIGEECPGPLGSRSQAARPHNPPPAPVKTHPSLRSGNSACLSGSGGSKSKFKF